jgi:hypothetical protein
MTLRAAKDKKNAGGHLARFIVKALRAGEYRPCVGEHCLDHIDRNALPRRQPGAALASAV